MGALDRRPGILVMWGVPRSRSTAFFRMMCERGDYQVLHEPFSYRAEFGETMVDGAIRRSDAEVLEGIRGLAAVGPVFFKDTTDERYPGVFVDSRFLAEDARHTFIIRHPLETIASYHALNPSVKRHQIGFEALHEIFDAVWRATGRVPVVVDSEDLATRPEALVAAYCREVGIPHLAEALRWRPGSRQEWAPSSRWHADVSASTGFSNERRDYGLDITEHPVLSDYLAYHLPFYEELLAHRLTFA